MEDLDEKFQLNMILEELSKGHIAILTQDVKVFLGHVAAKYAQTPMESYSADRIEALKYLVMICNILYNRTDMQILPVEDGVYDMCMELYKKFDPHFQVGSMVVQFQDKVDKQLRADGQQKTIQPVFFIEQPQK